MNVLQNNDHAPRFETVAQFCKRWQISRRKFDLMKAAGHLAGIIQPSPRFIRIDGQLADAALRRHMIGGVQ